MTAVDLDCRTVTLNGKTYRIPRQQFNLIAFLARRPGMVRNRPDIMDHLGMSLECDETSVDNIVKKIRRHGIEAVRTSWGVGYYWEE